MNRRGRQEHLAEILREQRLEGLLVTHLPNVRYLCGFTGSAGALTVSVGKRGHKSALFTDGRYTQQAREQVEGARVVIPKTAAVSAAVQWLADQKSGGDAGVEAGHMNRDRRQARGE